MGSVVFQSENGFWVAIFHCTHCGPASKIPKTGIILVFWGSFSVIFGVFSGGPEFRAGVYILGVFFCYFWGIFWGSRISGWGVYFGGLFLLFLGYFLGVQNFGLGCISSLLFVARPSWVSLAGAGAFLIRWLELKYAHPRCSCKRD